jgi:hypothetical protein
MKRIKNRYLKCLAFSIQLAVEETAPYVLPKGKHDADIASKTIYAEARINDLIKIGEDIAFRLAIYDLQGIEAQVKFALRSGGVSHSTAEALACFHILATKGRR